MESLNGYNPEKANQVSRGMEIAREIAKKHESELRAVIDGDLISMYTDEINAGPITTEQLVSEFEEQAKCEGIDLTDFYTSAIRQSLAGHRFELLGITQILFSGYNKSK